MKGLGAVVKVPISHLFKSCRDEVRQSIDLLGDDKDGSGGGNHYTRLSITPITYSRFTNLKVLGFVEGENIPIEQFGQEAVARQEWRGGEEEG